MEGRKEGWREERKERGRGKEGEREWEEDGRKKEGRREEGEKEERKQEATETEHIHCHSEHLRGGCITSDLFLEYNIQIIKFALLRAQFNEF